MASVEKFDVIKIIGQLNQKIDRLMTSSRGLQFKQGIASARPASPTVSKGATLLYFSTDTSIVSIWNTSTNSWVALN